MGRCCDGCPEVSVAGNNASASCVASCCYLTSWYGSMSRENSMFHGVLQGWVMAICFHAICERTLFMCIHFSSLRHIGVNVPVVCLALSILYLIITFVFHLCTFMHITCFYSTSIYDYGLGVMYKASEAVWTSALYVRVSRLCFIIQECSQLRRAVVHGLRRMEKSLLSLAVISPIIYAVVHFATIDNHEWSFLSFSTQFAIECYLALLFVLGVSPVVFALGHSRMSASIKEPRLEDSASAIAPEAVAKERRAARQLQRMWLGCFVTCLAGPAMNAGDIYQISTSNPMFAPYWDLLMIFQIYTLTAVLAPISREGASAVAVFETSRSRAAQSQKLLDHRHESVDCSARASVRMSAKGGSVRTTAVRPPNAHRHSASPIVQLHQPAAAEI